MVGAIRRDDAEREGSGDLQGDPDLCVTGELQVLLVRCIAVPGDPQDRVGSNAVQVEAPLRLGPGCDGVGDLLQPVAMMAGTNRSDSVTGGGTCA